jgi:hypothetical protein
VSNALAAGALGAPVVPAPGMRSAAYSVFVRAGRSGASLRIGRRPVRALAIVGQRTGPAVIEQVLELKARSGKHQACASRGAPVALSPSAAAVVSVRLTATQRRLVRSARTARVVVRIGVSQQAVVGFAVRLAGCVSTA